MIHNMNKEKIEIRSFSEQPKITDGRTIEGYAVVFGVRSQVMYDWLENRKFVEIIEPNSIAEELLLQSDVRALIEHNPERLLARSNKGKGSLTLELDTHGLKYRFEAPNTTHGNDIIEMVQRGDISGSSFAFRSKPEFTEWKKEASGLWLRTVKRIDYIRDVTMTADPAYAETEVSVRSIQEMELPTEDKSYINNLNNLRKLI